MSNRGWPKAIVVSVSATPPPPSPPFPEVTGLSTGMTSPQETTNWWFPWPPRPPT
jgi:hypothetical protein